MVVMVQQVPSEVMSCAKQPTAIGLTTSRLQPLVKLGHVGTVMQLRSIHYRRILLHEKWAATTVIGLAS